MGFIALEDLVGNMTPEQKIFCSHFYATFNNRSAANRRIINVEPIHYEGAIAGSEFLTYAATKLYLILQIDFDGGTGASVNVGRVQYYNAADAVFLQDGANVVAWNATTAAMNYIFQSVYRKNIWFSRFAVLTYGYTTIIGYRITLQ